MREPWISVVVPAFNEERAIAATITALRRFIRAKGVTAIVVEGTEGRRRELFRSLGVRPEETGGVLLYRLGRPGT